MAAVTVTAAQVAPVFPDLSECRTFPALAGTALTAGMATYFGTADGKLVATNAATADTATQQFHGIVLKAAGSAQATDLLTEGHVYGFTLTNVNYGGTVYAGTAAGTFSDTAVGGTVPVGICVPLTDADRTKVLYVKAAWLDRV